MSTAPSAACPVASVDDPRAWGQEIGVTRESTVSLRVLRELVKAVELAGGARGELLRAARMTPRELEAADGRIARAALYPLCELAIELTGDPAFGLHWAERLSENTFGLLQHLISYSPTLRRGLEALAHFSRLLYDDMNHRVVELEDRVIVRLTGLAGESLCTQRFCAEMMIMGFLRLVRGFGSQALPERVGFAYPAPSYHAEYARAFGPTAAFEQPFTGIVFARSLLDAPATHDDQDVREALQALAQRRLLQLTERAPYALRVREFLVRQGGAHRTDMRAAARAVGLSARSLRRRLKDEGKSYSAVASEARASLAQHLLRDQARTIQETAHVLGFSDASAFHRAFRRWTGMTPAAFRAAQRR